MKKTTGLLALLATLGFAATAHAQAPTTPLSIEIRGGAALPMGDLSEDNGDATAETGYTFGLNANFQATPVIGIYAGWSRSSYGIEDVEDVSIRDQGFSGGIKASFAGSMPVTPFLKGGVLFHELSISGDDGETEAEISSDNALGFEIGGGVAIPLGQRVSVTPGITYSKFNTSEDDELFADVNVGGLRLDVGLNFRI